MISDTHTHTLTHTHSCMLTCICPPVLCAGLPGHVHPPHGHGEPHQFLLRQQHAACGQPGHERPRRLRLPARGQSAVQRPPADDKGPDYPPI